MIAAGVAFALALASLGLSIRKITSLDPDVEPSETEAISESLSDSGPSASNRIAPEGQTQYQLQTPSSESVPPVSGSPLPRYSTDDPDLLNLSESIERVPAGRWWLIAALVALLTAVGGYWVWADDNKQWSLNAFWDDIMSARGSLAWTRAVAARLDRNEPGDPQPSPGRVLPMGARKEGRF